MIRKFLILAAFAIALVSAQAQTTVDIAQGTRGNLPIARIVPGVAGQCLQISGSTVVWAACPSGTVTGFSAGNLSPLFTGSVATSTTTPALSFALSNAAAHKFLGNNTASSAAPGYVSITAADLPGVFAQSLANAVHKWLNSYDASTGLFTQTQPDYGDLTGTPTLAATKAAIASNWLNSYDAATGLFTATRPAYTDLTSLPQLAITKGAVASNWMRSYDSTTGLFTISQPSYTDISGTPVLPATLANTAHKWFNSYSSVTGLFTQTQPDYSDLTGTPTLPANTTSTAHQFFTAWNSGTGAFSKAQPDYSDLTGSAPVTSVFVRTGAVTATSGDYSAGQVTNAFDVTVADTLTNVVAPATPAAAKTAVYIDSTTKTLSSKNDAGTVSNTVVSDTGAANNFLTAISAAGVISKAQPSFSNLSGTATAAQLPNPSATTLGGIESLAAVGSKWINTISTAGVPSATQPAFSDLSGAATAAQLPNPSATTLGGIESLAAAGTKFINAISTAGVPSAAQPAFTDLSGSATCAQEPALTGNVTTSAGSCATTIAAAAVTRADLAAGAANWAFCGTATAAATTVGPVNAGTCCNGGTCRQFQIFYYIENYNGGTPVGRLLMGPGTPSTTALTNGNALLEGTTTINTTSVSVPGTPLAVTLSALSREGVVWIDGASGKFKRINILGQEGAQSVSAAPTMFRAASNFSDLSTNLPLQQFQLTVYDTLTSTAASAQTFISGTYLIVWGRNGD